MMRPIFDLQMAPEPGSRWNKEAQDEVKEAEVSHSVSGAGRKLDELRNA